MRQFFILKTTLRKHKELTYDSTFATSKRRSGKDCPILNRQTAIAGRHYYQINPKLYNKINLILYIFPRVRQKHFKKLGNGIDWLLSLE